MTKVIEKPKVTLEITEDGSATLRNQTIDECYHSIHGAQQESEHIFIEAALRYQQKHAIAIFEVGFGPGLNAMLWSHDAKNLVRKTAYTSL